MRSSFNIRHLNRLSNLSSRNNKNQFNNKNCINQVGSIRFISEFISRSSSSSSKNDNIIGTDDDDDDDNVEYIQCPKGRIPLVFVRHGQSTWNQKNIFIGMTDTPLTPDGVLEARLAGSLLNKYGVFFDVVYTSLLRRSTKTVWLVMQELMQEWVPVIKDWRLNERSYGALVGRNKKQCVEEFGVDQVKKWRRSWDIPPPPMSKDFMYWPGKDPRYEALGITDDMIPQSESLKDVTKRTSVFWDDVIVPQLKKEKRILIVGHENNLRSIIKRLDGISEENIIDVELPRAIPLYYELDENTLKPLTVEGNDSPAPHLTGRYLGDPAQLKRIFDRDQKQVYDLNVKENLETGIKSANIRHWMTFMVGPSFASQAPAVHDKDLMGDTIMKKTKPNLKDIK